MTECKISRRGLRLPAGITVVLLIAISNAFAIDEAQIDSALASHMCPFAPFSLQGLPDYSACEGTTDIYEKSRCQDVAFKFFNKVVKYNKACEGHASESGKSSPAISRPSLSATPSIEDLEKARHDRDAAQKQALDAIAERNAQARQKQTELQQLKEEIQQPSASCQKQIDICQKTVADLGGGSGNGLTPCQSYCYALTIEKCNLKSDTLRAAAENCKSDSVNRRKSQIEQFHAEQEKERQKNRSSAVNVPPAQQPNGGCGPGYYRSIHGFFCFSESYRGQPGME